MPFRERARAMFKRKSSNSRSNTDSDASSHERWPSNVYQPGEAMPRPKYRKPPTKEHKEHLEAFSFSDAWRRRSFTSVYSPMGTRAPSRRNSSRAPSRRPSFISRKSYAKSSRANSFSGGGDVEKSSGQATHRERERYTAAMPTSLSTEEEADGDDDVHNVGLSRVQSHEHKPVASRPLTAEELRPDAGYFGTITAHDHQPFSEHELTLALQRSHLAVPAA